MVRRRRCEFCQTSKSKLLGVFDSEEEVWKLVNDNWENMHEHWNNAGVIEYVPKGCSDVLRSVRKQFPRKWFRVVEGKLEVMPEPKCAELAGIVSW